MTKVFDSDQMRGFGFFQDSTAHRFYKKGEIIFHRGDLGEGMYIVVEGEVSVTIEEHPIDHLYPGSVLGEMALIDTQPRSAAAAAATDCKLLYIGYDEFVSLTRQYPDFAIRIMRIMSNRLRRFMLEEVGRQRMEEELVIGRQIQLSLLPEGCPQLPGWEFAAFYRPARQVGGDLYDFMLAPDDPQRINIVIADVTGKGVPAALFMAMSRTLIRAEIANGHGPAMVLKRTNNFIARDAHARLFLSMFYASLDTRSGHIRFASGGHEWPLWRRASTGSVAFLKSSGFLLGVLPEIHPVEREAAVEPGDFLILFTDGLTETRNEAGEMFGEERLVAVVERATAVSAPDMLHVITTAVTTFAGETPPFDDFTLVVVKRKN
ncbi:MAG: SpoIIE family protein phosphatase [Ardenticatenaceae bacterium]|nr:SpoIIE family protein phosphatase [Ardenticatenaceae bacterium]